MNYIIHKGLNVYKKKYSRRYTTTFKVITNNIIQENKECLKSLLEDKSSNVQH